MRKGGLGGKEQEECRWQGLPLDWGLWCVFSDTATASDLASGQKTWGGGGMGWRYVSWPSAKKSNPLIHKKVVFCEELGVLKTHVLCRNDQTVGFRRNPPSATSGPLGYTLKTWETSWTCDPWYEDLCFFHFDYFDCFIYIVLLFHALRADQLIGVCICL